MQLFYCPEIIQGDEFLSKEESFHCIKVLRKQTGDFIDITDAYTHSEIEIVKNNSIVMSVSYVP